MKKTPPLHIDLWQSAKHILCVRLDTLGDVLMTTPAMRALKESSSGRIITLITSPVGAAIARLIPEIDHIIEYEAPWVKATAMRESSAPEYAMIEHLREQRFDGVIIFTTFSQSPLPTAMMCYLAEIPLRLAYCHENPYQLLTDYISDPEPMNGIQHEVERQLELVAAIGCSTKDKRLSLSVPPEAQDRVARILDQLEIQKNPQWLVMHPGASAPSRRYPPEGFAVLANTLSMAGWEIIFTGIESELHLVKDIQDMMRTRSWSLVGKLNLAEMSALIAAAPLLITNNTGPAHIAAAVGTRVVDLYALTNPQHTPWHVPSRVLSFDVPCKNCFKSICPEQHHKCLRMIEPKQVVQAAFDLMKEANDAPSREDIPA